MHNGVRTAVLWAIYSRPLALWLEKAGLHHSQRRKVRVSWGTEEETSLSSAITDPQHFWEYATVKVSAAAGPAGPIGSEVPLLETQVAPSLGASEPL